MAEKKNKGGRPIKLSERRIMVADDILEGDVVKYSVERELPDGETEEVEKEKKVHEFRAIFLNDDELVTLVNMKLEEIGEEELTFDYRTFARYKKKIVDKINEEEPEEELDIDNEQEALFHKFCHVIKKHLILQKQNLFQKFQDSPMRQKYAWIIERKFGEWNLKKISENTHKSDPVNPFKIVIENPYNEDEED